MILYGGILQNAPRSVKCESDDLPIAAVRALCYAVRALCYTIHAQARWAQAARNLRKSNA